MFCLRLEQLNISWCSFSRNHVQNLVETLSPSVTHLNLSGYRDSLVLDGEEPEPGQSRARTPALDALQGLTGPGLTVYLLCDSVLHQIISV